MIWNWKEIIYDEIVIREQNWDNLFHKKGCRFDYKEQKLTAWVGVICENWFLIYQLNDNLYSIFYVCENEGWLYSIDKIFMWKKTFWWRIKKIYVRAIQKKKRKKNEILIFLFKGRREKNEGEAPQPS